MCYIMLLTICYRKFVKIFQTTCKVHLRSLSQSCKLLIVGGGTAGCALAAKLSKDHKRDEIIIVEPNNDHYYQPLFTFIGCGCAKLANAKRKTEDVLPRTVTWIKDEVTKFKPSGNMVILSDGGIIHYEFMVIAIGIDVYIDKIPGLNEALEMPNSGVCTIYIGDYAKLAYECMKNFKSGNAIFTHPNTPVKCAGASLKICNLTEHYLQKANMRDRANILYYTCASEIFGVERYATALLKVMEERNIVSHLFHRLVEIKPKEKIAVIQNLQNRSEKNEIEYEMLHVTPPMGPPKVLENSPELTSTSGFVHVNPCTLQHVSFPNIFSVGDCTCLPTSKTAAAAAVQVSVVYKNLKSILKGEKPAAQYNGYTACPLLTRYGAGILAEFGYDHVIMETFPFKEPKERWLTYYLVKDIMPFVYWNIMLKGYYNGPDTMRKILHLGRF